MSTALPDAGASLCTAALAYAARGWLVFPCLPAGKHPATRNGLYAATTNAAAIRRWWGARDYNIGIRCGAPSRLWVVDLDGPEAEIPGLPPTLEAETARGRHLYFASADDLPSTVGKIGEGIDTRGRGGYVLAPPSVHPSGAVYRWTCTADPIPAPDWLIEQARGRTNAQRAIAAARPPPATLEGYGRAALNAEIGALVLTPKGARNNALNRSAFSLFQLVHAGKLSEAEVLHALHQAAAANGLIADDGEASVGRTIQSAREAAALKPRGRP